MKPSLHQISVARTAHYYTIGQASKQVRYFILACHGYGQLVGKFSEKFGVLAAEEVLVVVPEGLSKFYWPTMGSSDVGASWMTREHRLDEIADYSAYLQQLYDHFVPQLADDVQIILLGFSQGCATQCRWIMRNTPRFHRLILWAGLFPEDIDYSNHKAYFQDKKLHLIYGLKDEYLTLDRNAEHLKLLQKNELNVQIETFDGRHRIDPIVLKDFFERLKQEEE